MDFEAILNEAHAAADAAILARFKSGEREREFNCGFAWVTIDGNSALARHCRKFVPSNPRELSRLPRETGLRYGSKADRGWQWWKPGTWPSSKEVGVQVYGQDVDFHHAASKAFVEVLAKHGIRATAGMRYD